MLSKWEKAKRLCKTGNKSCWIQNMIRFVNRESDLFVKNGMIPELIWLKSSSAVVQILAACLDREFQRGNFRIHGKGFLLQFVLWSGLCLKFFKTSRQKTLAGRKTDLTALLKMVVEMRTILSTTCLISSCPSWLVGIVSAIEDAPGTCLTQETFRFEKYCSSNYWNRHARSDLRRKWESLYTSSDPRPDYRRNSIVRIIEVLKICKTLLNGLLRWSS